MCFVNGKKITDIGGIGEVVYNGTRLWSKYLFKRVVVVGDSTIGFAFSKDDGSTFTRVAIGGSHRNLKAVKRIGNAVYVAGDGGLIAKTTDLDNFATWTVLTGDSSFDYIDICEGGGKIVILAEGNKCSVGTTSGTTFTTVSMPGSNLGPMTYGNGKFIAPSGTWGGTGAYSTNGGASWTAVQLCATKRRSMSGYVPEAYPCRNICYGNGIYFCESSVWDGSSHHYEYSYSTDGVNWQKATTSALDMFVSTESSLFFNGYFYTFKERDTYKINPANMGSYNHYSLWDFTGAKHSFCTKDNLALLASSGEYLRRANRIGIYKDDITDDTCLVLKDITLEGTIREVLAI